VPGRLGDLIFCSGPSVFGYLVWNEMGGACGTYGGAERGIQGFGGETGGKQTIWKTRAYMGG